MSKVPDDLITTARHLYGLGFNIVWIGADKKPLGRWSADERLHDPEKPPRGAIAVAITGKYFEDKNYVPVGIDVDDPDTALEKLRQALGEDPLKKFCGYSWSLCGLTGPRPKGQVKCSGDTCVMPDGSTVPADQVKRGMYFIVLVPARCAPKHTMRFGEVEFMVSNYQVVYGQHPSGLRYQFVRYEDGRLRPLNVEAGELPGAGVILTCDEWSRIVSAFSEERREEEEEEEEKPGAEEIPVGGERHSLSDPQKLLARLKELWPVVRPEGGHFHDVLLFAVASLGRRLGVPAEELEPVFNELFAWAVQNGLDDEKSIKDHQGQWRQAYKPDAVYWGRRSLRRIEKEIRKICYAAGYNEAKCSELIGDIYDAFGVSPNSQFCTPDRYTSAGESALETVEWICNTTRGIVHRKRTAKRNKETGEIEYTTDERVIVEAQLIAPHIFEDVVTHIEYISTTVRGVRTGTTDVYTMVRVDAFVEQVGKKYRHRSTLDWRAILNSAPRTKDIIVSGPVCPPPSYEKLPCAVRDYFGAGIRLDVPRHEAKAVLENMLSTLDRYSPSNLWYKQIVTGYAGAMFQNFALTRKLHQQKAWIMTVQGPPSTGKTTLARLALYSLFPNYVTDLLIPAGRQLTAARIGRAQSRIVTTLMAFDEAEMIAKREELSAVLKSYATSLTAWGTAGGDTFPAYAGIIMTANALFFADPALVDKIAAYNLTEQVDVSKMEQFNATMPWGDLVKFGSYYVKYVIDHWAELHQLVLGDSPRVAVDIFRTVLEDLGYAVELLQPEDPPVLSAASKFFRLLTNDVRDTAAKLLSNTDQHIIQLFDMLLEKSALTYVRPYNATDIRIPRDVVEMEGINIEQLCRELEGKLIQTKGRFYKHCIISRSKFQDKWLEYLEGGEEENEGSSNQESSGE